MRTNTVMLAVTLLALLAGSQLLSHGQEDAEPVTARASWHIGSSRYAT